MADMAALNYLIGIFVSCDKTEMFLSQRNYALELLERAHMSNCNSSQTHVDTESKLDPDSDPITDPTLYRSLTALKRILRYFGGTLRFRLHLYASTTTSLIAYSNADWVGCPTTRRSTSGVNVEYRGVARAVAEAAWLCNLLRELHMPLLIATLAYCDNVSAIYLSANPVQHQRTKRIEIDFYFVRDIVAKGQVRVLDVPSRFDSEVVTVFMFQTLRASLDILPYLVLPSLLIFGNLNVTPPDGAWTEYVSGGVTFLRISSTKHKERPLRVSDQRQPN
nr:ribonuclease H-like domain-containing protein [Tanacetum cinerariifolium]